MNEQEQILMDVLECRRVDLLVNKPTLNPSQEKRLQEINFRRAQGEPLQYILGSCEFMGLKFLVDGRVLIPRPETEILVEAVVEKLKNYAERPIQILDLGTGSGNITISLAKAIPQARLTSVDVSAKAIELAQKNAVIHVIDNKIQFVCEDMFNFLTQFIARTCIINPKVILFFK